MWHHVVYPTCLHKWWKQHSFLHIALAKVILNVLYIEHFEHIEHICLWSVSMIQYHPPKRRRHWWLNLTVLKNFERKKSYNCHSWNAKKNLHRVVSKVFHLSHLQWESRKRKNLPHSDLEVGSLLVAQYRSYCWMSLKEKPGHPNFWISWQIWEGVSLTDNPLLTEGLTCSGSCRF